MTTATTPDAERDRRRFPRRKRDVGPPSGAEERRYCDDRRHDVESRQRIEWLEVRYRRVTELLFASMVTTLVVCTLGLVLFGGQADKIGNQADRIESQQTDFKAEQAARARDSRERIDQGCRISEGKQRDDVENLKETYKYLLSLTPQERHQGINAAVMANLPKVERDARIDDAPAYCDAPHVGLPEPDPVVPERPAALSKP